MANDRPVPVIHAATAMFPAVAVQEAVRRIVAGVSEPLYGAASTKHIQLCPQSFGELSPTACEQLVESYPDTSFRCHANARVLPRHLMLDASTFSDETEHYYRALADRSHRLGASAYSLHAGYAANATLGQMLDNVARIQALFGDCAVAIEGLYPDRQRPQLMSTWAEYEQVLRAGVPLAVDLSHLQIVAKAERSDG